MTDSVTYYAALPLSEDAAREAASNTGWSFDERLSRTVPPHLQIISLRQDLDDLSDLSQAGADVQQQLKDALEVSPAAIAANAGGSTSMGMDSKPRAQWEVNLLPSTLGPGVLSSIIDGTFHPVQTPASDNGKSSDAGGSPPSSDPVASADGDSKTAASPSPPAAASISAAISALVDPSKLWDYLDQRERGAIAKSVIDRVYEDRSRLSRRSEWIFAPEMTLIEASPLDQRQRLAEQLLLVKGQLTDADNKSRESSAQLVAKEVELSAKRVALADKGVELAGEMVHHMKKWRSIATIGLVVLCFTTLFSMAAVGYMLTYLMPGGKVGEVAAPIVIFALALFAVSPAVLLLRERPLEGIDKWSPSGESSETGGGGSGDSTSGEGDTSGATASPPAAS